MVSAGLARWMGVGQNQPMALSSTTQAEYFDFLRFATVSADPARAQTMRDCASWLAGKFQEMGMKSEIVPTAGAPVVLAFWRKSGSANRRTVLIYISKQLTGTEFISHFQISAFYLNFFLTGTQSNSCLCNKRTIIQFP